MARRGREGMAKRAREQARQQRQEAKRERRQSPQSDDPETPVDEAALMEEFRILSERHAAGGLTEAVYLEERHRIFVELGIEADENA